MGLNNVSQVPRSSRLCWTVIQTNEKHVEWVGTNLLSIDITQARVGHGPTQMEIATI